MTADGPMTAEQAATLKSLAHAAYELDAFKPKLTRTEADISLIAKFSSISHRTESSRPSKMPGIRSNPIKLYKAERCILPFIRPPSATSRQRSVS